MPTTPVVARLIYPHLPEPITVADLRARFTPIYDERQWAMALARTGQARIALLTQLKIFQTIGRFVPLKDIPAPVIARGLAQLWPASLELVTKTRRLSLLLCSTI